MDVQRRLSYTDSRYGFFREGRWLSALAAAVFDVLLVDLLRNVLDAAEAAFLLVTLPFAISRSPPVLGQT